MICPRFNSELNEVARDGVMIDVCNQCRGVCHYDSDHHWKHEKEGHHTKKKSGIIDIFDIFG